jgi:hypothetical protein
MDFSFSGRVASDANRVYNPLLHGVEWFFLRKLTVNQSGESASKDCTQEYGARRGTDVGDVGGWGGCGRR